jgi:hypothetical protein
VLVKTPQNSKVEDVTNGVISIILAGVVAPWMAVAAGEYLSDKIVNEGFVYALAFVLSVGWPYLIKMGLPILRKRLGG